MKIVSIEVKPEKKTADVWDAVTETVVNGEANSQVHLVTRILNERNNTVGKTETDFTINDGDVSVIQSVLTYSPVTGECVYRMVCELYDGAAAADKQEISFSF